ncbi:MAG TPA: ABC transporter ATP-binding protein [Aquificales bacterium]|nr:ABC transporter ATP-binding protein [Aquificales bacterium]HIO41749.1 ABC transporter ATP-binding protein [Aquifex sp.]
MGALLEVRNLKYRTEEGKEILKGVNLDVKEGEIHVLLGPNGAGKSTLANLIAGAGGYEEPTEGEIIFDGKVINGKPLYERAKMGLTIAFQEPARFEGITVEEYLKLSARNNPDADIEACLRKVGLDPCHYLHRFVDDSLSGGERKRIELASIMCMKPKLAVLDEIDSGIDFVSIDEIGNLFKTMRDEGTTLLVITHRENIANIADRASLLCDGQIVETGDPRKIIKKFEKECLVCEVQNPSLVKEVKVQNN